MDVSLTIVLPPQNTFTIQVRDESADFAATTAVTLSNNSSSSEDFLQRSTVLLNVLQALESVLPDLRATFNALDTPKYVRGAHLSPDTHHYMYSLAYCSTVPIAEPL